MIKQLHDAMTALLAHAYESEDGELPVELSTAYGSFKDMGYSAAQWKRSLQLLTDEGVLIRGFSSAFATLNTNVTMLLWRST